MRCLSYCLIKIHRKFTSAYLLCDKASLISLLVLFDAFQSVLAFAGTDLASTKCKTTRFTSGDLRLQVKDNTTVSAKRLKYVFCIVFLVDIIRTLSTTKNQFVIT